MKAGILNIDPSHPKYTTRKYTKRRTPGTTATASSGSTRKQASTGSSSAKKRRVQETHPKLEKEKEEAETTEEDDDDNDNDDGEYEDVANNRANEQDGRDFLNLLVLASSKDNDGQSDVAGLTSTSSAPSVTQSGSGDVVEGNNSDSGRPPRRASARLRTLFKKEEP